ncbi:hypothetical protein FRB99_000753 [Tulasnella sp. 403]|nr:hypothetical protein FRB99_000753 [Tulasnella sp. 403]
MSLLEPTVSDVSEKMGKRRNKGKTKALPPDDDKIYLYLENPFGMGTGADLRSDRRALAPLSQWIHHMVGDHGIRQPEFVWTHPKTTAVILTLEVPGRDEQQVQYLLGLHRWKDFVRPSSRILLVISPRNPTAALDQVSTVSLCTLQAEDDIATHEFFEVPLAKPVNFTQQLVEPYPRPSLPSEPIPRAGLRFGLPAAPPPPPPPSEETVKAATEPDDKDKKAMFSSDVKVALKEELEQKLKKEILQYEMGIYLSSRDEDVKPKVENASQAEVIVDDEARERSTATTIDAQGVKVEAKQEMLEAQIAHEMRLMQSNNHAPQPYSSEHPVKSEPASLAPLEAQSGVQHNHLPSGGSATPSTGTGPHTVKEEDSKDAVLQRLKQEILIYEINNMQTAEGASGHESSTSGSDRPVKREFAEHSDTRAGKRLKLE